MKQKTAGGPRDLLHQSQQGPESLDAVDRGGAVELGGEGELGGKNLALFFQVGDTQAGDARVAGLDAIDDPAVEPDLPDPGGRIGLQGGPERFQPLG